MKSKIREIMFDATRIKVHQKFEMDTGLKKRLKRMMKYRRLQGLNQNAARRTGK